MYALTVSVYLAPPAPISSSSTAAAVVQDSSSATTIVPPTDPGMNGALIAAFIIVPIIVISAALAIYYLYFRNGAASSRDDRDHVELHDVAPAAKGRPVIRGPDLGAFTRGGGQNFNRLLTDAEVRDTSDGSEGGYQPPRR